MKNYQEHIHSQNNLTLCSANYFQTCWCQWNSSEPTTCPYLLQHVKSLSNSTYFCVYHTIRNGIECFRSSLIFPSTDSVSSKYISFTIVLFLIGLIGNGLSLIILFHRSLRSLSVYRNLAILCLLNLLYLSAILVRHQNFYHQDLRDISPTICRWHTFIVAFTGHLCSWQLVSTSTQRVNALLSLQVHGQTSWIRTVGIFIVMIVLPLLIFDGQLLWNYGLFANRHMCEERLPFESRQFQRARRFPINLSTLSSPYQIHYIENQSIKSNQCDICILWNIFDTFLYAIIPFLIILISSIIIILQICQRRRSTIRSGGICHTDRQDYLSIILISINCLFFIMTGPFNITLIIQSIIKHFFPRQFSMKTFKQLNEYLRTLQNSYHAFSFLFYCVLGEKFRKSSASIYRRVYRKFSRPPSERSSMVFEHKILDRSNEHVKHLTVHLIVQDPRHQLGETYL